MGSEVAHGETEKEVFSQFAKAAGLRIGSIHKCFPPEPDLRCTVEGEGMVAFELAEICAEDVAVRIAHALANSGEAISTADPSERVLRKKLGCRYEASHPIELLLYTNARVVTPDDAIIATIQPILFESQENCFRRVWLFGERGVYEVWRTS